jgi:hypothetical protein
VQKSAEEFEKKGDRLRNRLNVGRLTVGMLRTGPGGGSDVWQIQDLEKGVFGSVAIPGLTGEFSEVWQEKNLGNGTLVRERLKVEEEKRKGKKRGRLKVKS